MTHARARLSRIVTDLVINNANDRSLLESNNGNCDDLATMGGDESRRAPEEPVEECLAAEVIDRQEEPKSLRNDWNATETLL
ncbi:hypothetical protein ASPCADRAFT_210597 [Aspergillus carbonarius ITEM 5010]|uniref:Uncharacterized protein n=1 Tax=Aspergillus carbonarius (strain ITEM 5010) TaxID=602072 RepID=A0A1R3RCI3_ASPC5|nr:hypothetical protein ASPCADRAFT_210597 [Aspergillus carbonarius ITEM 5010]